MKEKLNRKSWNICWTTCCHVAAPNISASFLFIIKQQWTIEEIYIFSNSSHLEWRSGLSYTIL